MTEELETRLRQIAHFASMWADKAERDGDMFEYWYQRGKLNAAREALGVDNSR